MKEEWKNVPQSYGRYIVSNLGRVASNYDQGKCSRERDDNVPEGYYLMRQRRARSGYNCVSLMIDGKRINKNVHRMVMEAFVGPSDLEVNHINEVKTDNRMTNLEYVTKKVNRVHSLGRAIERVHPSTGRVIAIYSSFTAAKEDGYNVASIHAVCNGSDETYKGYYWRYHDEFR